MNPKSKMTCYVFVEPIEGKSYNELIQFCCSVAKKMCLVLRDTDRAIGHDAASILHRLESYEDKIVRAREWPGTTLLGHDASVYWYRVEDALSQILQNSVSGLFDWIQPDAPEDLAFLRDDGSVILTTISHEKDAWLKLFDHEFEQIRTTAPSLVSLLRQEGDPWVHTPATFDS